jgi:hypothetical protein
MVPWSLDDPAGRTMKVSFVVEERETFSIVELDEGLLIVFEGGVFKFAFGGMVHTMWKIYKRKTTSNSTMRDVKIKSTNITKLCSELRIILPQL